MKQKLSITIDGKTVKAIEGIIKKGKYRNKSHIVEYSLNKLLVEEQDA